MTPRRNRRLIQIVAVVALGLAIAYLVAPKSARARVDDRFLILMAAAVLVLLIPWERLTSFKAGPLEAAWEQPQVAGATRAITDVQDDKLRRLFKTLSAEIDTIRGSRVLWIDDNPDRVLGERRLLRALHVDVLTARSSEEALDFIARDNDFDLVITDLQRRGSSYEHVPEGGAIVRERWVEDVKEITKADGTKLYDIHEGANFVAARLRMHGDESVRNIPVVFYAAYTMPLLRRFTDFVPDVVAVTNSVYGLFTAVIPALAEVRERPTEFKTWAGQQGLVGKGPTSV